MEFKDPGEGLPFFPVKKQIKDQQIRESWRNIKQRLPNTGPGSRQPAAWRLLAGAAAGICLLVLAYLAIPRYRTIETTFGEIRKVYLPDSTLVVLNSNSSLRYPVRWEDTMRYVRLEGEAFFEVTKKPLSGAKFTVQTKLLDVEVQGTVFNVNAGIAGRTEVSLNEGRVLVKTKNKRSGNTGTISMMPGEVLTVEKNAYRKTLDEEVAHRSAWINNDFYFDSTPLADVATMIERKYGHPVHFKHDSLRSLQLSGTMHAENFVQFEKALEVTMKITLTLQADTLYIGSDNPNPL